MTCPSCNRRKGKRECPALRQTICTVCCGTKRLVEIDCPAGCPHLASAREHPAAVVKRQQQHDAAVLVPIIRHLTERQYQLFFLFHTVIARHQPDGFARLVDADVAEAAATVAATLETAARGVIYQHTAASLPAQRLANELTAMLAEIPKHGVKVYEREAAIVLRAIEQGARDIRTTEEGPSDTAYLALTGRLLQAQRAAAPVAAGQPSQEGASSIIIP